MADFRLDTERLTLRAWRDEDIGPFQTICADPRVMVSLGPVMTLAETAALVARMQELQAGLGHCFWALERRADARLLGWCGAIRGSAGPVADKIEIGWRLASDCWGQGYASEAARATVGWCLAELPDDAVWAITNVDNHRSRSVMARLGMRHRPELDFDHPKVPEGDPLRPHVAYVLERPGRAAG